VTQGAPKTSTESSTEGNAESPAKEPALGTLDLSSELVGTVKVAPTVCRAGDAQSFLGGDFIDEKAGVTVRLVVDPLAGPAVRAFANDEPFVRSVVFQRAECRVFHMSLQHTGITINDVRQYRVSLDVDCANAAGDALLGKLASDSCD